MSLFEVAAVASLLRYRSNKGWEGLEWLCLLNEVDPDETTLALRELSEDVRTRKPEPSIHPDLPARVAALLLWLSGQESDEDAAVSIDPGIDRFLTYEKDYLPRPGRSLFPLERRHAESALIDTELPLHVRVQRTKELWLDPSFDPPAAFLSEVRTAAAHIEVEKLSRYSGVTMEDHRFEELEPILARCAPDLLADLMRRKMQSIASCPAESRYWSAIHATDHLLLAGEAEAKAARTLRLSGKEVDNGQNCYVSSQLLMLELQDLDSRSQFDELISADLKYILTDFVTVLHPPTPDDVDALIARYNTGSPKQQHDLVTLLSIHPIKFSDTAWSWLNGVTNRGDHDLRGLVFKILSSADATRFGQMLMDDDWSWGQEKHLWVNHYGTGALIEATQTLPFDQVAPRLAPWRLLEAARIRGADRAEVRLAAAIFGHVLVADKIDSPDPGAILSVDRTEAKSLPFIFSVKPWPSQQDPNDFFAPLKTAMDFTEHMNAYRRAVETAGSRIRKARISGASLYLANVEADDFAPVLQYAPDMVEQWLEGSNDLTTDFRRRVCLAESAFLALCEALLSHHPIQGAKLWHSLRVTITTRYIGVADVEDLVHMVFRVPDSPEITALRDELVGLNRCHTDQALFDLAVTAFHNGKADWLATVIKADRASILAWKRKRGAVLAGFTTNNILPVTGAWPDREIRTRYAELERKSARFKWIEACAHHWWRVYLNTQDPAEAYAAWVLFLLSADNRAWIWMREDLQAADDTDTFFKLKLRHARLNQSDLKRAMGNHTEKLDKKFVDREIYEGIGPWGSDLNSASPVG